MSGCNMSFTHEKKGLPVFETGKVLTDAHDVVPFRHSPARNALISLSSCSVLVDDNGTQAGQEVFHPDVVLGLSGDDGRPQAKALG